MHFIHCARYISVINDRPDLRCASEQQVLNLNTANDELKIIGKELEATSVLALGYEPSDLLD